MTPTHIGMPLVIGMTSILPLCGFPEGRVKIRMRPGHAVRVYVRTVSGDIHEYVITEVDGQWHPFGSKDLTRETINRRQHEQKEETRHDNELEA